MSVIVEFTVSDEEFALGQVLAEPPEMHIELERIVPTGGTIIPFLWVQGEDIAGFEQHVIDSGGVSELQLLDQVEDWVLYRIMWTDNPYSLLEGIESTNGVILEAVGDDGWHFRLRFPNHDHVSQFYNFCTEQDIEIHIERSYTLTEKTDFGYQFGLSREQREALILGLRRGYFDTPRQANLADLADEFGISQQATSNRIRRGTKQVLAEALLSSAVE